MSHLNNVGLRHNKTTESILLIFTQFPTTCCLGCPQSKSKNPEWQGTLQSSERNLTSRFLVLWFRKVVIFLHTTIIPYQDFLHGHFFFHFDNPNPVERETISNPIQIRKNPNIRLDWTPNPDLVHQCWTWSGFRIAIQPDFAIQNWHRIGLYFEITQVDQIWTSKLHWSL